jgi:predicted CXXCH cytochrome family protein
MIPKLRYSKVSLIVGGVSAWGILLVACVMTDRIVVAPPQVAGAKFVGSEQCVQCHEDITKGFESATHAKIMIAGENAKGLGCESCHGPGSKHVETGGATGTIVNPRKSPETCFQCHLDKRGEFSLPHSHPVLAGHMSCVDCHDVHKGDAIRGSGASLESQNETCTRCHTAQKGPFVFEHEAMREGCTVCHNPHGTVNAKMLLDRDANLCLRCHLAHPAVAGTIVLLAGDHSGPSDHTSRLEAGACWSAGCHEAVHGSNANAHLRY